jgi:hypothetical protein
LPKLVVAPIGSALDSGGSGRESGTVWRILPHIDDDTRVFLTDLPSGKPLAE